MVSHQPCLLTDLSKQGDAKGHPENSADKILEGDFPLELDKAGRSVSPKE